MIYVPDSARMEIKSVARETCFYMIENWIHLHSSQFFRAYPDRLVNSVYFDTYDFKAFTDNVAGVSSRSKVRYRWYGDSVKPDAGVLEVKHKRNLFGWKDRFQVSEQPCIDGKTDWSTIRSEILRQVPNNGKYWLHSNPLPMFINRYQRRYFESAVDGIRVTLDSKLSVWDQRSYVFANTKYKTKIPSTTVIEIKFQRKNYDLVKDFFGGFPLRVTRNSKYTNAVCSISGYDQP